MQLHEKIRAIRVAKGLSAREVSLSAGLAQSTVGQYERQDIRSPSLDTIKRIATALDVPLADLVGSDR